MCSGSFAASFRTSILCAASRLCRASQGLLAITSPHSARSCSGLRGSIEGSTSTRGARRASRSFTAASSSGISFTRGSAHLGHPWSVGRKVIFTPIPSYMNSCSSCSSWSVLFGGFFSTQRYGVGLLPGGMSRRLPDWGGPWMVSMIARSRSTKRGPLVENGGTPRSVQPCVKSDRPSAAFCTPAAAEPPVLRAFSAARSSLSTSARVRWSRKACTWICRTSRVVLRRVFTPVASNASFLFSCWPPSSAFWRS
mmetsp:Transcript_16165/g.50824  ORF Transcript_16165/g.50824 Transcript_16165/m.50824 type:complete len:253 (+) Transcript_16165:704-1462(+)